jgi:hypothetical protein
MFNKMLKRISPPVALVLLSPIVAEFLLGDFSIRQAFLLLFFIPQYGGGALLVRELARRAHRGWPTILWLALAYALIEEGLTTQTLFNPDYAGQRLLDYGYVPALGTSLNWAVFVLTLHIVWSIGSAIAVAEGLSGDRANVAWLGRRGLVATALVFIGGCVLTTAATRHTYPFLASARQFAAVVGLTAAAVGAAFLSIRGVPTGRDGRLPSTWFVGAWSLLLCSLFHLLDRYGQVAHVPAVVTLTCLLGLEAIAITSLSVWSQRRGWSPRYPLAAASGAILTYGWVSLSRMIFGGVTLLGMATTKVDNLGQVLLLLGMLGLIALGAQRLAGREEPSI